MGTTTTPCGAAKAALERFTTGVEHMAEAAAYLASCSAAECTGRLLSSGALLREIGHFP
jgi:hypothetical protein